VPQSAPTRSEIAVILPCYNVEGYLQRSLSSAIAQSYSDFHIYAVNDGSTDHTLQILEANSHLCSFVTQLHTGPAAARNRAIQMSSSPFVAFLDADDEWLPTKLERQIAFLRADPTLGLVCSLCRISGPTVQSSGLLPAVSAPHSGRLFQRLIRNCFIFTPTVVVRRSCLEDVGLFNESLLTSEDFNLWLRIAARWKIALIPEILAITHKRLSGSLSSTVSPEQRLRNGVAAIEDVRSRCPQLIPAEERGLRLALAERLYFEGSFLLSTGAKSSARTKLAASLKLQFTHWRALAKLGLSYLPTRALRALARSKRKVAARRLSEHSDPFQSRKSSLT
jgi:cellulose synthase/poly-beta-1,6-N-acetylglucosamine synthase-like glycosyltransferase